MELMGSFRQYFTAPWIEKEDIIPGYSWFIDGDSMI
jgi:hypothetical protein